MSTRKIFVMAVTCLILSGIYVLRTVYNRTQGQRTTENMTRLISSNSGLTIYPAPSDEDLSKDYRLEVNGKAVDIYLAQIAAIENRPPWTLDPKDVGGPYSFSYFDFSGSVTIKVSALNTSFDQVVIRPLSAGIKPVIEGNTLTFNIHRPCKLSIEPNGRREPLLIFANPLEIDPPKIDDPDVIYYGPGIHKPEKIILKTGQTLYIAGGAVVKSGVAVSGKNIKIKGRGILCGNDWEWKKGPGNMIGIRDAENVSIEGIILRGSWSWTIPMYNSKGVNITNVKMVCSKNPNDDGINPCNSQDVYIGDCFIRTDDDCIAMKGITLGSANDNVENIVVENCILWSDRARVFLLGHESRAPYMRHITLSDLEIIHFNMSPFLFEPGEEMSIENVRVENVRLYADYPKQNGERTFEWIRLKPTVNQYMKRQVPGRMRNLYFKNLALTGEAREGWYYIWITGADEAHQVTDVTLENITWFGERLDENSLQVKIGDFTNGVKFRR
ncbi:glycosyl hydrolase family 28 protein [Aestuariivivens sediminicola]|uniref:glycosyl hydrolase family 28 protein n=1 Tax=Aestuariivivens sediminicola TaxID=2913560 RepID=UPI001F56BE48|nr:glycosyl hydrolase family 28 protein [Aestuariivivens sediminicola]